LAKNAEANAKLRPKKASTKTAINLSLRWIYVLFIALLAFQIYLNVAAYYAVMSGMKNFSLFIVGVMMLVFAGMFHLYRHGRSIAKAPPIMPRPAIPPKPMPFQKAAPSISTTEPAAKQLAPPPAVQKSPSAQQPQSSSATHSDRAAQTDMSNLGKNAQQMYSTSSRDIHNCTSNKPDDNDKDKI
jgi:ubiquinol-cytochrome c reductase cytochrome b subunit